MNVAINQSDTWLNLREAAGRAKVHPETLRTAVRRREIRHAKIGGRRSIRLRPSWVDEWIERKSVPVEVQ
jgi:excisionase family DNA binding protein